MILRTVAELRAQVAAWKAEGHVVGVVPTMGALHEGHLSLARAAKRDCGRVITTIFVNPKQFNNPDDLLKYPRTEDNDAVLLATVGVDTIFAPPVDEVYPEGFVTSVSVGGVSAPLEGALRPGHFDGVSTVVTKLFGMSQADRAYFGQKDWQQLQVVRRLVRDLNLKVEIVGCETVRDPDGLAMSSRNQRLTAEGRRKAPALYAAMLGAARQFRDGMALADVTARATAALLAEGFDSVEYIDIVDADLLGPVTDLARPLRMLAAAWIADVRLIDNIAV